jgi:RNA polymerase sigma factor for flagellar operon FliA
MTESATPSGRESTSPEQLIQEQTAHQLIESGQKLVHSLAREIHRRFSGQFDYDDLVAYGQVGLAQAAGEFDPQRGARFTTYAYYRIRGSIYEGVSKLNWTSRAQYNRMRADRAADEVLQQGPHRSDGWAGTSLDEDSVWLTGLSQQLAATSLATFVPLGEFGDTVEDDDCSSPLASVETSEVSRRLRQIVSGLDDEPRQLIEAVYFDGTTLQEAADRIGVSKSWASRLHARTLQILALSLREIGIDDTDLT